MTVQIYIQNKGRTVKNPNILTSQSDKQLARCISNGHGVHGECRRCALFTVVLLSGVQVAQCVQCAQGVHCAQGVLCAQGVQYAASTTCAVCSVHTVCSVQREQGVQCAACTRCAVCTGPAMCTVMRGQVCSVHHIGSLHTAGP